MERVCIQSTIPMSSHPCQKGMVTRILSNTRHCSINRLTNPTSRLFPQVRRKKLTLRHRSLLWSSILAHSHLPIPRIRGRPRRITMDINGVRSLRPLLPLLPTRHTRLQCQQRLLPFHTPFRIWGTTTRSLGCHLTSRSRCLTACPLCRATRATLRRLNRCRSHSPAPRAQTVAPVLDLSPLGLPVVPCIMYVCH